MKKFRLFQNNENVKRDLPVVAFKSSSFSEIFEGMGAFVPSAKSSDKFIVASSNGIPEESSRRWYGHARINKQKFNGKK